MQTKRQIQATLRALNISPLKRYGQNFLIDGNLMRRLVETAEIAPGDAVLEVGGGTGSLTDLLAERARYVVTVEIYASLARFLRQRFAESPHLTVINGDVLVSKHRLHPDVHACLQTWAVRGASTMKLVANLPYQVATPLVMNLLVDYPQVSTLVFSVQAEVADRILAAPGTRAYGTLSVVAQLCADCRVVCKLPAHVFWPEPAVESAMVCLAAGKEVDVPDKKAFVLFVRAVFDHRRKMLRKALAFLWSEDAVLRASKHYDLTRRPETLTPEEFVDLYRAGAENSDTGGART